MIYLSCPVRRLAGSHPRLGAMLTPRHHRGVADALRWPFWAADNGCYAQGAAFDLSAFLAWLGRMAPARATCLFAVAPDVVGDAAATLARTQPVLPTLRALGYRAALVAQDGLESLVVPWDALDALFVGGRDPWRRSAHPFALAAEARRRGKWVHWGRVNGGPRLHMARVAGAHSADGTELRHTTLLPRVLRWLDEAARQPALPWCAPARGGA